MCGIFALLNTQPNETEKNIIENEFNKSKNRGPEFSTITYDYHKMVLGFHRLAINGLNIKSNQPLIYNNIILICNGEIYNYVSLYDSINVKPTTDSDCEIIIHMYLKYGIEQTLIMLDGVYSFVLYDNNTNHVYVARDPFGVVSLYIMENGNIYGFSSELKSLEYFYNKQCGFDCSKYINQFKPGTYSVYRRENNNLWNPFIENKLHFMLSFPYHISLNINDSDDIYKLISKHMQCAVLKRCITTERPVACLLSGGLDSSLVASLVANVFKELKNGQIIETYSIGLEGSEDIKYAQLVANHIGSKHTNIIITEQEMFDAIPEVIKAIESYDTTTVRASIGNYLIGKYISKHSEAKVIFNGDGSDELFGGYLYMNKCKDDIEFDKETRRLLMDIYNFDVLRSHKSMTANGLESRTPFLDRSFNNYILSLPAFIRNHNNFGKPEKYLLREAFSPDICVTFEGKPFLPNEILNRKKEAFSDGVSSKGRSLFVILQEFIALKYGLQPSIELEKQYYKELFNIFFPNCEHVIPYYWMPKYTNATDPSARTLDNYNN